LGRRVSESVAMRRMNRRVALILIGIISNAYALRQTQSCVPRENGIPLPWGNMSMVEDPCQHWAVFRKISEPSTGSSAQISILNVGNEPRIYACESIKVQDLAGNSHVLCSGIDPKSRELTRKAKMPFPSPMDLKQALRHWRWLVSYSEKASKRT